MKIPHIICFALAVSSSAPLWADEAQTATETTAKTPPLAPCCGVKLSGYVEGSYNYLRSDNQFISGSFDRENDIIENGFAIQQMALTLAYQPKEGFGGLVNVIAGLDAFELSPFGYNPDIGSNHFGFIPLQVFGQYASDDLTFMVGNFNSLVGIEGTDPTTNNNFSMSQQATLTQPNTVLGLRATYAMCEKLKLIAGINNGWDNIRDTGRGKTIELSVAYTPSEKFSMNGQFYTGEERVGIKVATGPKGRRNLVDIYGTYNLNDKISLAADFDYGSQSNVSLLTGANGLADWVGIAGYFNYKFTDHWKGSIRLEDFNDNDGYRTGVVQNLKEGTLSLGWIPFTNALIRVETRRDYSNVDSFIKRHDNLPSKIQQSYAVEVLYQFSNS